ncbi:NrtA/SsuA/CpmA family ABC transporter substrate-binding protein [Nocardiopsis sp. CT-R113]|uniref:NrtA/SsuA/CpmA family ABC transporter substrate-binding protein n=1 Tax=Nocardiopsis codii TaxID=3065942 RepID=A0ABU7K6W6_9ACTN|nr:NrtA/SsuA/CpmA family ABC transporter substrate-binding protein [Nocardiopsis sp. CT-R113]MEE2037997.1 NrtA/SsuA/CpmA family ABC transporter substrate-binding protein [Nocardiopsis sp. CT-R113]
MHSLLRTAVLPLAAVFALTSCGTGQDGADGDDGGAVLRLIDPGNAGPLAYAKHEGIFEERLAEVGATIEWGGSYASFTAASEALRTGDINIQQGALSPAVGALATSEDLRIFNVSDPVDAPAPLADGLVVPADSDVRSLDDLRGGRVAVNQAGKGEYLLLRALDAEGIDADEVERVYLNPQEGASAFASGELDAWWAIVDAYPEAVANGAQTIVTSRDVDESDLGMFAARVELLEEHPEAVEVFHEVYNELIARGREEPELFQNVFLDQGPTALSGQRLDDAIETTRAATDSRYPQEDDLAAIEVVGGVFHDHGVLAEAVDARDVVFDLPGALG